METCDEVVDVGDVGEDVVADEEVGLFSIGGEVVGAVDAEEVGDGVDTFVDGGLGDVLGRFDAGDGDAGLDEILEEVAVVGSDLDDVVVGGELESLGYFVAVGFGVVEPGL